MSYEIWIAENGVVLTLVLVAAMLFFVVVALGGVKIPAMSSLLALLGSLARPLVNGWFDAQVAETREYLRRCAKGGHPMPSIDWTKIFTTLVLPIVGILIIAWFYYQLLWK